MINYFQIRISTILLDKIIDKAIILGPDTINTEILSLSESIFDTTMTPWPWLYFTPEGRTDLVQIFLTVFS